MTSVTTRDYRIDTPQGGLFAKRWLPEDAAAGIPFVLMHDSLGCVALWRDFPERLAVATGRPVIAYDRLGFGRSDPNPEQLRLGFVEAEAERGFIPLCEQMGLNRALLLGHSVGGAMATVCAARYPARCAGLVTVAAQNFAEDKTLKGIAEARDNFADPDQFARLERYHGSNAGWVLSAWVDTWLSAPFKEWDLADTLARVHCPILALHGEQDYYGSPAHIERFVSLTPADAHSLLIPECGHVPHREKPRRVLTEIQAFLDRQPQCP